MKKQSARTSTLPRVWECPELIGLHKLPARADFDSHPTSRLAIRSVREKSPWFLSLDGTWDFRFFPSPTDAETFLCEHFRSPDSNWGQIPVPSNWQMHGFHYPHYTNIRMPFGEMPPLTPASNPTGIYRRTLTIPPDWEGHRVVVHFGAADSVLMVYLDGHLVGISKDSRLPAEFDLTQRLVPGSTHEIVALVVQYSDASFLEDQDMWRLGGLPREVYLFATPRVYLANVATRQSVDLESHTAELEVFATAGFPDNRPLVGTRIEARLFDAKGRAVGTPVSSEVGCVPDAVEFGSARLKLRVPRSRLSLWSHENPVLYKLLITLVPAGLEAPVASHTNIRIGFRSIVIQNRDLLINGQRVLIKGANYHEHHPDHGKAVPIATRRKDMALLKRFHFNAIRLSHYPQDRSVLDLCDEFGIYAIDEANVECHAFRDYLSGMPSYATPLLDRVSRMVIRDINHASVIAWSLGNESGYAAAHDAAAAWVRHYDPTRPVHYEGAISRWDQSPLTWMHGSSATDFVSPMYAGIEELKDWLDFADKHCPPASQDDYNQLLAQGEKIGPLGKKLHPVKIAKPLIHPLARPVILCEYSHAMGNSNGSLSDYFELFKTRAGIQGGFIWEWRDHGIRRRLPDGREHFAYGGDFGDEPNDGNFVYDGLISADQIPHPACFEHQRLAQPLAMSLRSFTRKGITIRIQNDFDFTRLDRTKLYAEWTLLADGVPVKNAPFPAKAWAGLAPGGSYRDSILSVGVLPKQARELHLKIQFRRRSSTLGGKKGDIVAASCIPVSLSDKSRRQSPSTTAVFQAKQIDDNVVITNGATTFRFDTNSGVLSSLRRGKQEFLVRGPLLEVWRAATDNEGNRLMPNQPDKPLERWRALGLDSRLQLRLVDFQFKSDPETGILTVSIVHDATTVRRGTWKDLRHEHRYEFSADGTLAVINQFFVSEELRDLPRLGVRLDLPPGFERLRYFGRGPFENYSDRKMAADPGIWETTVLDEYVDYVMPQEHGHHTDTRWLELSNGRNRRSGILRIEGQPSFEFNATHFPAEDLFAARRNVELKQRAETILYLDAAHRGIGSGSVGPDTRPEYRIPSGHHTLEFLLSIT